MHKIDASFSKDRARKLEQRRKRQVRNRILISFLGVAVFAGAIAAGLWLDRAPPPFTDENIDSEQLVQQQTEEVAIPVYVPVIIDLPGDPVHIELGEGGSASRAQAVPVPTALAASGVSGTMSVLSANVVESGERLSIALPSTQQDFAFFQSQRATAQRHEASGEAVPVASADPMEDAGDDGVAPADTDGAVADDGGDWGDIESAGLEGSETDFAKTEVDNNTTTLTLVPEQLRATVTEDFFVRVVTEVETERFLQENKINLLDARIAARALKTSLGLAAFEAGSLVAMRQLKAGSRGGDRKLVQIAIYLPDQYLGALALTTGNAFIAAADPWASRRLTAKMEEQKKPETTPTYRLLDGIFSAGLRNGVPASVTGEAIMYLSRQYDLGDLAGPDDRMSIVYSDTARAGGQSAGRILYIAVTHAKKTMRCFVYAPRGESDFKCLDEHDVTGEREVANGIVVPVAGGVLTSGFGPRRHPILKTVLLHKGVDWAAPVGTPVLAAMDGTVAFAGDGGTYGNLVKLAHDGGRETRYAHLNAFAKTTVAGAKVQAGDVIGYIGTTGRSTGPHLHFEMYFAGQAVDPLSSGGSTAVASAGGDSDAVTKLVNRIVQVESGGNATAKNPLSSATGLGQFIDSTWMRMMRTYRPDLANSLPREKLLALRFDPTLSREMVTNLAKENRAYLVSSGHSITAGRLYLAHFLGPEGARIVLSSGDDGDLAALLGGGVISANPFLHGKNVAYLKDWAERKMQGRGYVPQAPSVQTRKESVKQTSPEFALFRKTLLEIAGNG